MKLDQRQKLEFQLQQTDEALNALVMFSPEYESLLVVWAGFAYALQDLEDDDAINGQP